MNEEIIFVSKTHVQKMPQRLYYESKKSCNFCKKWSLYYSKLKHRKVEKSILSRRFNDLYGHLKIGANWCRLLRESSKLPDNLGELNINAMSQTWSVTGLIHSPIIDKKLRKFLNEKYKNWKNEENHLLACIYILFIFYLFYFIF